MLTLSIIGLAVFALFLGTNVLEDINKSLLFVENILRIRPWVQSIYWNQYLKPTPYHFSMNLKGMKG